MQHVIGPDHGAARGFVVLGGTGAAVVVIGRVLGPPGDVELLVDNIHVSGLSPACARCDRSFRCRCSRSRPAARPDRRRPSSPRAGRSPDGSRGAVGCRSRTLAASRSPGWRRRLRCCSRPRSARRCSRSRSCIGEACSTTRRWSRRSSARCRATRATSSLTVHRAGPGVADPRIDELRRVRSVVGRGRRRRRCRDRDRVHLSHARSPACAAVLPARRAARLWAASDRRARSLVAVRVDVRRGADRRVLATRSVVGVLVVAFVAKMLATSLTVSSGWPGGFIIPFFFIGATDGADHAPRVR